MILFSNFQSKICILKDFKYSNFRLYWNVISDQSEKHTIFYKIVQLIKEMNLALSTVGNIIRKYKKYGDGTANLPRNGRPRKKNERTSRWISRSVQIKPFITRSEIKIDLEGAGINVSKDTISRALYRTGFHSRSPRKVPLLKIKHVKDRLEFVETYEKKKYAVLGKSNLVGWNESWTIRKEYSDKCLARKWHCLQEGQYHSHS